jgi:methanogenic corrinoid protein MtbC1
MDEIREKEILQALADVVVRGEETEARALAATAMREGLDPHKVLLDGLAQGMARLGEMYERQECFVPGLLLGSEALEAAVEVIKPFFTHSTAHEGTVIIGTVAGDVHDIGKNLVVIMLRNSGFIVHDLGSDVDAETFANEATQTSANLICMSSLMTTTMQNMKTNIEFFNKSGLRDKVKIMVGGSPVTEKFAQLIGGDGYAKDAVSAVRKAKELMLKLL